MKVSKKLYHAFAA